MPPNVPTVKTSQIPTVTPTILDRPVLYDPESGQTRAATLQDLAALLLDDANLPSDFPTITGWQSGVMPAVSSVTNNGQRSSTVVYASSVASLISVGMRARITRTTTSPTKCTSLNGTTQYWNKTSPNKITWTDDFVATAYIKLSSYANGGIISRFNGTSGWQFGVDSSGRLLMAGYNGGASNFSLIQSHRALPLNRWVRVTGQLDMSGFSVSATTSYLMVDDCDFPAAVSRGGTNPTALVQAGDLMVGAINSTTPANFFPGKIAQAAVFNAKVTQSTLKGYTNQGLSGSETSLASAWSFDSVATDLNTTTPNDLTANGSATATNADSPYSQNASGTPGGTYDYGIAVSVSGSTVIYQHPEGCSFPTSGSITATDISGAKAPYGMPIDAARWALESLIKNDFTQASPSSGTWYNMTATSGTNGGATIEAPAGLWIPSYEAVGYIPNGTNAPNMYATLSTANNSESDQSMTSTIGIGITGATSYAIGALNRRKKFGLNVASNTVYYLNVKTGAASATSLNLRGSTDANITISLEFGLL